MDINGLNLTATKEEVRVTEILQKRKRLKNLCEAVNALPRWSKGKTEMEIELQLKNLLTESENIFKSKNHNQISKEWWAEVTLHYGLENEIFAPRFLDVFYTLIHKKGGLK